MNNLNSARRYAFGSTEQSWLKQSLLILAGVIVLALASQISIPLLPVPITFQSTTVVLLGMLYGARGGLCVVAVYLLAGILGLPVFADFSSGLLLFSGPTAGYLIGFLLAAFLSGYLAEQGWTKSRWKCLAAASMATAVIFLFGLTALSFSIGLHQALMFGLMPFLFTEPCKLLALSLLLPMTWKK